MDWQIKKIEYFHSIGRIKKEDYEEWILTEGVYIPQIMTEEEYTENFKQVWEKSMKDNPMIWIPTTEGKDDKILKVLTEIQDKLNRAL